MTVLYAYEDVIPCLLSILSAIILAFLMLRIIKMVAKRRVERGRWGGEPRQNYIVTSTWAKCDGEECEIKKTDRFRVLAIYEDSLLIDIPSDENSPYFVEKRSAKEVQCIHG